MSVTVEKCLQAWTNSLKQMNAKADIVFLGDSLTYYGDFSSVFHDKVVCNLGLRGDTVQGMMGRIEQINLLKPKYVFLMVGINDVRSLKDDMFKECYEKLVISIKEINESSVLILQSLLPVNNLQFTVNCNNSIIEAYNTTILQIARKYTLSYLDLFNTYNCGGLLQSCETIDGIHLRSQSYNKWYKKVRDIYNSH